MNKIPNLIPNRKKAIFYAEKNIAQIISDVVQLEDINYTVVEVQTLLDGITVGGHKLQDEKITLNQVSAWHFLFNSLKAKQFQLTESYLLELHHIVAQEEALSWGKFRNGAVTISGTNYLPPSADSLTHICQQILSQAQHSLSLGFVGGKASWDTYNTATILFAKLAKSQLFFDGNKRTARMMMSGILLDAGYPMINIPASYKLRYNQAMINYYNDDDHIIDILDIIAELLQHYPLLTEFI